MKRFAVATVLCLGCLAGPAPWPYPATRTVDAADTYFGRTYLDPFRWLEDLKDPLGVSRWFAASARALLLDALEAFSGPPAGPLESCPEIAVQCFAYGSKGSTLGAHQDDLRPNDRTGGQCPAASHLLETKLVFGLKVDPACMRHPGPPTVLVS